MADEVPFCHRKNAKNPSQDFIGKPRAIGVNRGMRFLAFLALILGVYFVFVRPKSTPVPDAVPVAAASASASPAEKTPILRRPIDRTREVLKTVGKRNADGF